jgi:hypothetical protein
MAITVADTDSHEAGRERHGDDRLEQGQGTVASAGGVPGAGAPGPSLRAAARDYAGAAGAAHCRNGSAGPAR